MRDQVREGGMIFFRESCFRQSGDAKRSNNPTHYRNPRDYFAIFDGVEVSGSAPSIGQVSDALAQTAASRCRQLSSCASVA